MWISSISLLFIASVFPFSQCDPKLIQANVIFRHGCRSPTRPIDPNNIIWTHGYDELTEVGIQQLFDLGEYLRYHYRGFINSTYINDELRVRSSDFDRTLMSGEALLSGMYPPSGFQIWNKDIGWQPISIHTVTLAEDILLAMDDPVCPLYSKLLNESMTSEKFRRNNESFTDYYEYLKNKSGKTGEMSPYEVWNVYDNLHSEFTIGIPYPSWVKPEDLYIMAHFFIPWQYEINFGGLQKGRLKGGPLITELVSNMNRSRNGTLDPKTRKLFLYSGHDNNIVTTMKITGTFYERYVEYGSSLHVELYEEDKEFFVMMKLRNDTGMEPRIINITVCEGKSLCPLDEFIQAVSPYFITMEQWLEECRLDQEPSGLMIGVIIGAVVVLILLIGIIIYLCQSKRKVNDTFIFEEDDPYDTIGKSIYDRTSHSHL